jgi:hypothetical protein
MHAFEELLVAVVDALSRVSGVAEHQSSAKSTYCDEREDAGRVRSGKELAKDHMLVEPGTNFDAVHGYIDALRTVQSGIELTTLQLVWHPSAEMGHVGCG